MAQAAAPSPATGKIPLYYSAGGYESTRSTASLDAITEVLQEYFVAKHPGIDLKVNFDFHGNSQGLIAAMLAGSAPDVFEEYTNLPLLVSQGLLLDLSPYIQRDNLNLDQFLPGEINAFRALNATGAVGQYALPAYVHQFAMMVNLGVLDDLGLPYPSEQWDYSEAEKIWRAAAGTVPGSTTHRYGTNFLWQTEGPMSFYLHGWGGAYVDPQDPARCVLDQPQAMAAGQWIFGLIQDGVGTQNFSPYTDGGQHFRSGQLVSQWAGTDSEMPEIAAGLRNVKFRFYPMPRWPRGWFTANANDFHAIWAGTRYPEAAWELERFLATDVNWQRALIKLYLAGPALNALWPEYIRTVEEYAPPLRHKNLDVFLLQVERRMPMFHAYFQFESDNAFLIVQKWTNRILSKQVSLEEGFSAAAREVNAFEAVQRAAARSLQQAGATLTATIAREKADPNLVVAAPPRAGEGTQATAAPKLVTASAGSYEITGLGSGLQGTADGGTFACAAWSRSRGRFICRVVAIANGDSPQGIASGAAVGLMARANLGSEAPEVALVIQSNRGIHFHSRPLAGLNVADQRPRNYGGGLLPPQGLLHNGHKVHRNDLLRPVWLRLDQVANTWTAYTSLDGNAWTAAGIPVAVQADAFWIGLFVSPHDASFGDKPYTLRARFDHVSGFTPTTFVTIGTP